MYLPDNEIERVAVSMIAEFGNDAERAASGYANSAKFRGFGETAEIWGQVRERISYMRGDNIREILKAA